MVSPSVNSGEPCRTIILSMSKDYTGLRVFPFCMKLFLLCVSAPLRLKPCYGWSLSFDHQPLIIKKERKDYHLTLKIIDPG